jgi:hypothetical protein
MVGAARAPIGAIAEPLVEPLRSPNIRLWQGFSR